MAKKTGNSKIYVKEIIICRDCPECSRFVKWCFMMRRDTEEANAPPSWCPLEDIKRGRPE